jgi:cell division protein FtsW (lipid II flippase)
LNISEDFRVKQYLNQVCSQIQTKEVISEIRTELLGHLEDAVEQFLESNVPEEETLGMALVNMGDPLAVGKRLHQVHKPKTEWSLIFLVSICIFLGAFNLYLMQRYNLLIFDTPYFLHTLVWVLVGILLIFVIQWADYRRLQIIACYLYLGTLLTWMLAFAFGHLVKGTPYLFFGPIQINFVVITPYILTVVLAALFGQWDWNSTKCIVKGFMLGIIPISLYVLSNSLLEGVTFFLVFLMLMQMSGAGKRITLTAGFSALSISIIASRLQPERNPSVEGWIYVRISEIIHEAGWWGHGLSLPENTLPAIHTDLVLAYVIYTFGWLAGLALILIVSALAIRMFVTSTKIKDLHGRLTVFGLAAIFAVQITWNGLMIMGLAPIYGMGVPFFSYGGTQYLINLVAVGLALTIFRRKDIIVTESVNKIAFAKVI